MSTLELRFLGEFAVVRDGRPLALPPSKKTRALLAYLSLEDGRFSREQLCELLWELPDDPRGSLRWSLSKLRRLVDDAERKRVVADRSYVEVDASDLTIDVADLRALVQAGPGNAAAAELADAAARYRGNFLEGIEFSGFHDFHSWCITWRERSVRDCATVLAELVRRDRHAPERVLPHARALVRLSPYDEASRAALIGLLLAAGQPIEADEQYRLGLRMLKEAGIVSSGALAEARGGRAVAAAAAAAPAAASRQPRSRGPELIGRDTEVASLNEALRTVVDDGRAAALLLRGAPGIGKSRLLRTLLHAAGACDASVLHAAAFEADAIRPFALWTDALRGRDSADYEQVFAASDDTNRDRLFAALAAFATREAAERPVVIVFDDMHWCDESSAAALHYVLRMCAAQPLLAVVAARSGELRDNTALQSALNGMRRDRLLSELELGPLPRAELKKLIAGQAPDADAGRLSGQCAGNPLLAIELARAESDGSAGASLDELVRERLGRFDTAGADMLRWASVLLPPFDVSAVATASGYEPGDVGEVLAVAESQAMLVSADSSLRFSHDLIRKAVYNDISPLRRQVMHRRQAEALVAGIGHDLIRASWLAHHATLSGDPGLAARAMVAAGRLSLRFFANDDAAALARKGLQFAATLSDAERVPLELDLHDVLLSAAPLAESQGAAELYAALAERALDLGDLDHARLGYHMASHISWAQGRWDVARRQTLHSARVVRGDDSEAHVVGMAETAKCLAMLERDLSQADAMLMEATSLAQRRRIVHPAMPAGLGMLRFHEDRLDEAEELFEESHTLCKSAGDRLSEFLAAEYLVLIALQRGRLDEAHARAERLVVLGRKIREGSEKPFAEALLGLCRYALDDDSAPLDAALGALRDADAKYRLACILTRAALLDCERGRRAAATGRAEEALRYAMTIERPTEMLLAHAVLACAGSGAAANDDEHEQALRRLKPNAATWAGGIAARLGADD